MPDEPRSRPPLLSRRSLLQGAVGTAGAATIIATSPNFVAAAPKTSQKAVNYQDTGFGPDAVRMMAVAK